MQIFNANIFDSDCFVVTIKTEGRLYGDISYQFHRKYPSVEIPHLVYGTSASPVELPDGKLVIFTCLWCDEERGHGYTPEAVMGCTGSAVRIAGFAGVEEVAIPLIGGGKKEEMKPHMEIGLRQGRAALKRSGRDPDDLFVCVCFVPRKHQRQWD